MNKIFIVLILSIFSLFAKDRIEIGQKAYIDIIEAKMTYLARIDSGARITSLHALNIKLEGRPSYIVVHPDIKKVKTRNIKIKNREYIRNIGRYIRFDTINEQGKIVHLRAKVVDVKKVTNAQGTEYRYVINLGVKYGETIKYSHVNLRDRSRMMYKLLIGRNWLNHDFLIKTDKGM